MGMRVHRRGFLRVAGLTAAGFVVVPRHVLGGARFVAPSAKVNVAIVGCGGQGRTNARALFAESDAQIIAVCDPHELSDLSPFYYKGQGGRKAVKAEVEAHYSEKTPNFRVTEYEDVRRLLEAESALDAVLCATPDHLHAFVSVLAMRAGKHVYCEKPLTHSIWEARRMSAVAKETGVATQMGNQGHSSETIRQTVEWIRDGAIGPVREVHAWSGASKWFEHKGRPAEEVPVPAGLNWDLWLGPREARPYHPSYVPVRWRSYWDFGTASLGDMACHNLDPAVWALELVAPASVEGCAPFIDAETASTCGIYTWRFAARGGLPAVEVKWYDGGLRPPRPDSLPEDEPLGEGGNGCMFLGEQGILVCAGWGGRPRLLPDSLDEAYRRPEKTIPRSKGHHRDWIAACKGGSPASSHFEYGARLTEIVLLGNVALRAGKRIRWDHEAMKAANAPEAEPFLKGRYRPGWEIG
jgi:predicted dehydrogenase